MMGYTIIKERAKPYQVLEMEFKGTPSDSVSREKLAKVLVELVLFDLELDTVVNCVTHFTAKYPHMFCSVLDALQARNNTSGGVETALHYLETEKLKSSATCNPPGHTGNSSITTRSGNNHRPHQSSSTTSGDHKVANAAREHMSTQRISPETKRLLNIPTHPGISGSTSSSTSGGYYTPLGSGSTGSANHIASESKYVPTQGTSSEMNQAQYGTSSSAASNNLTIASEEYHTPHGSANTTPNANRKVANANFYCDPKDLPPPDVDETPSVDFESVMPHVNPSSDQDDVGLIPGSTGLGYRNPPEAKVNTVQVRKDAVGDQQNLVSPPSGNLPYRHHDAFAVGSTPQGNFVQRGPTGQPYQGYQGECGQRYQGESGQCYQGESAQHFQGESAQHYQRESGQHYQEESGQHYQEESGQCYQGESGQPYLGGSGQHYQGTSNQPYHGVTTQIPAASTNNRDSQHTTHPGVSSSNYLAPHSGGFSSFSKQHSVPSDSGLTTLNTSGPISLPVTPEEKRTRPFSSDKTSDYVNWPPLTSENTALVVVTKTPATVGATNTTATAPMCDTVPLVDKSQPSGTRDSKFGKMDLKSMRKNLVKISEVREKTTEANRTTYQNVDDFPLRTPPTAAVVGDCTIPEKNPVPLPRSKPLAGMDYQARDRSSAQSKGHFKWWQCAFCQTVNKAANSNCVNCMQDLGNLAYAMGYCRQCSLQVLISDEKKHDICYCPRCKTVLSHARTTVI